MSVIVVASFLFWKGWGIVNLLLIALPTALLLRALYRSSKLNKDVTRSISTLYTFEVFFSFVWVAVLSMVGIMPITTIISFLALPIAIACTKTVRNSVDSDGLLLADLYLRTANMHRVYTALLAVSFIAARLISL